MRYLIVVLAIFTTSGCANTWYMDEWTVTDVKLPGISAIGFDQARQWYGAKALYSDALVTFRDARCEQPQFTVRDMQQAEFHREFRATFAALDIESTSVQVLEVGCPDNWTQPGSTFIQASPDSGYVLWDGAFFKLVRKSKANQYTYQCVSGAQVRVNYPDTETAQVTYQDTTYQLANVISASGARYAGEGMEWWSKGSGPGATATLARLNAATDVDAQVIERCEQI